MPNFLFVTDLDHTLVGDDVALARLNEQLSQHRTTYGTKIVYATGRSLHLYRQLAQEKSLLLPDALIASVGTQIYLNSSKEDFDLHWANLLGEHWDREKICAIASHFGDLLLQPDSEQTPFKVSYYLTEQAATEVIPRLKIALSQEDLQVKIIYSASYALDILPQNGDKGLALQYLRNQWGIDSEKTVVCGDSGNDIGLFQGEERGIIVGNAKLELRQWYQSHQTPFRYFAQGHYAEGILEGLTHFGFFQ